jgi:hypothetical protein
MQEGSDSSPLSAQDICADFIQMKLIEKTWQGIIDKFFPHH